MSERRGGGPPREPLGGPLAPARLVERPNRFLVRARREDGVVEAHLPNRLVGRALGRRCRVDESAVTLGEAVPVGRG